MIRILKIVQPIHKEMLTLWSQIKWNFKFIEMFINDHYAHISSIITIIFVMIVAGSSFRVNNISISIPGVRRRIFFRNFCFSGRREVHSINTRIILELVVVIIIFFMPSFRTFG